MTKMMSRYRTEQIVLMMFLLMLMMVMIMMMMILSMKSMPLESCGHMFIYVLFFDFLVVMKPAPKHVAVWFCVLLFCCCCGGGGGGGGGCLFVFCCFALWIRSQ